MAEHDILCPYCPNGVPMQLTISGTQMRCPRCGSTSPSINDLHTAAITPEDIVRAAARRRYIPPLRPMTINEILKCARGPFSKLPVMFETRDGNTAYTRLYDWDLSSTDKVKKFKEKYGRDFRMWQVRKFGPDATERAAAPWGGVQSNDT